MSPSREFRMFAAFAGLLAVVLVVVGVANITESFLGGQHRTWVSLGGAACRVLGALSFISIGRKLERGGSPTQDAAQS